MRDAFITREEIRGLMSELLYVTRRRQAKRH